ncbi:uncharacterized protein EURHEDRAFT_520992 [Aspergillus ruber CBS 135680]|uniref:Uncharacterized protein n=1 Tax=Aspergillus ruber (strain CBS 135680) TaxID=1388766 RepID=A0A017SMA8_ASPRC|nr:uncharacterized protein EURHEDRAFT_520992 [Aspergillus ruber CBS 135680]EYE98052.1 hypothetical protein EURHEDRAFT_520992 [Aspergillus ruber CBS 135680]
MGSDRKIKCRRVPVLRGLEHWREEFCGAIRYIMLWYAMLYVKMIVMVGDIRAMYERAQMAVAVTVSNSDKGATGVANVAVSSPPKMKRKQSVEHEHPRANISVTMDDALTAPPRYNKDHK